MWTTTSKLSKFTKVVDDAEKSRCMMDAMSARKRRRCIRLTEEKEKPKACNKEKEDCSTDGLFDDDSDADGRQLVKDQSVKDRSANGRNELHDGRHGEQGRIERAVASTMSMEA